MRGREKEYFEKKIRDLKDKLRRLRNEGQKDLEQRDKDVRRSCY